MSPTTQTEPNPDKSSAKMLLLALAAALLALLQALLRTSFRR